MRKDREEREGERRKERVEREGERDESDVINMRKFGPKVLPKVPCPDKSEAKYSCITNRSKTL